MAVVMRVDGPLCRLYWSWLPGLGRGSEEDADLGFKARLVVTKNPG